MGKERIKMGKRGVLRERGLCDCSYISLSSLNRSCMVIPLTPIFDNAVRRTLSFVKTLASCPLDIKHIANAIYGKSFGGDIFIALGMYSENSDLEINSIYEVTIAKISSNSPSESLERIFISKRLFLISIERCSGAIKSINLACSLRANTSNALPFVIDVERTELASIINTIRNSITYDSRYLLAKALFIFLPNSSASFSVNFDFAMIDFSLISRRTSSLIYFFITGGQSISGNSNILCSISSGISIFISPILERIEAQYINVLPKEAKK